MSSNSPQKKANGSTTATTEADVRKPPAGALKLAAELRPLVAKAQELNTHPGRKVAHKLTAAIEILTTETDPSKN